MSTNTKLRRQHENRPSKAEAAAKRAASRRGRGADAHEARRAVRNARRYGA